MAIQDRSGNTVTGASDTVSIALGTQPGHSVQRAPFRYQWPRYYADSLSGLLTVP
ncbi:hypothetical protein [Archangium sp.]|uniref:hypothetical protein n=1 Tax=Archangium sp. TaxID=1872627 RepID=UPI002D31CB82|nr:hypothetical protein [Archangium sp.]HYO53827.1 hypothetical protein [Archangium sp.]